MMDFEKVKLHSAVWIYGLAQQAPEELLQPTRGGVQGEKELPGLALFGDKLLPKGLVAESNGVNLCTGVSAA